MAERQGAMRNVAADGVGPGPQDEARPADGPSTRKDTRVVKLRVEVVLGSILDEPAPMAVVGRYRGMQPSGSLALIDQALHTWISHAVGLGMVGSGLGEVFFVPTDHLTGLAADAVLIAGMGEPGRFTRDDLRYLMTNATCAVAGLGHDRMATLLIGSGAGSLPKDRALRGMLDGVCDALQRVEEYGGAHRIRFGPAPGEPFALALVESDRGTYEALVLGLRQIKREGAIPEIDLRIATRRRKARRPRSRDATPPDDLPPAVEVGTRITVTANRGGPDLASTGDAGGDLVLFQYAALSETAVIPVRTVEIQRYFADRLPVRLRESSGEGDQEKLGKLL